VTEVYYNSGEAIILQSTEMAGMAEGFAQPTSSSAGGSPHRSSVSAPIVKEGLLYKRG